MYCPFGKHLQPISPPNTWEAFTLAANPKTTAKNNINFFIILLFYISLTFFFSMVAYKFKVFLQQHHGLCGTLTTTHSAFCIGTSHSYWHNLHHIDTPHSHWYTLQSTVSHTHTLILTHSTSTMAHTHSYWHTLQSTMTHTHTHTDTLCIHNDTHTHTDTLCSPQWHAHFHTNTLCISLLVPMPTADPSKSEAQASWSQRHHGLHRLGHDRNQPQNAGFKVSMLQCLPCLCQCAC